MYAIEQHHQESKDIEKELVTINSNTPCLSEATEVTNEISAKLPSQVLIYRTTTSFDKSFKHLSMNIRIEVEKL